MMKKKYRWLAVILAGVMAVTAPVPVLAEETQEVVKETLLPEQELKEEEREETASENQDVEKDVAEKQDEGQKAVAEKQDEEQKAGSENPSDKTESETEDSGETITFQYAGGTGKAKLSCDKVNTTDGKTTAVIRISSKSYTHFYLGSVTDSRDDPALYDSTSGKTGTGVYELAHDAQGSYAEIPVTFQQDLALAGRTTAMSEPHWVNYTIRISKGNDDKKPASPTPANPSTPTEPTIPTEPETPEESTKPEVKPETGKRTKKVADDGTYDVSKQIKYTGTMFRIVACRLKAKDDKMTAIVTLSGKGYDILSVNGKDYKHTGIGPDGGYQFKIPVSALDTRTSILARGTRSKRWFEKSITVPSKGIKWHTVAVKEEESKKKDSGKKVSKDMTSSGKKEKAKTNGSTKAVNTSTTLKDGTYKPEHFIWSGGTGRVSIRCSEIIIKGGKSYAKIIYSSSHYQYVKAGGQKINCSHSKKTSSAVIPVQLNSNNKVIGMTTAMSAPHEIAYTMYFGLNTGERPDSGAGVSGTDAASDRANGGSGEPIDVWSKTLDEKAPLLPGLLYLSETEITYSKRIKIYHYREGYTLIEIDGNDGTDLAEMFAPDASAEESENSLIPVGEGNIEAEAQEPQTTIAEQKAQVYQSGIFRYLIVPEGREIPAGLDKQLVIIQQPTDGLFVNSEEVLRMLKELNQTEHILSGGGLDEIDYKHLIREKLHLMILSSAVLPGYIRSDLAPEQQKALFEKVSGHAIQLGMAMVVDRSGDETNALAKAEWFKVYGAMLGAGDIAKANYETIVANASATEKEAALKELK